jgi:hypothetical protein
MAQNGLQQGLRRDSKPIDNPSLFGYWLGSKTMVLSVKDDFVYFSKSFYSHQNRWLHFQPPAHIPFIILDPGGGQMKKENI